MNKTVYLEAETCSDCNEKIGFIKIKNPPVNSLSISLVDNLNSIIDNVSEDIKVLVFCAEGKGFCAGADLRERASMDSAETIKVVDSYKMLFNKLADIPCPTIAAIHGYALGGGLELALACDFRFSTVDAVFGFPETSLGIIPGAGGTQRFSRLVGLSKAKKWIFTADKFSAKEALEDSAIDGVFDSPELMMNYIKKLTCRIVRNSQKAISLSKKAINYASESLLEEGLLFERKQYLMTLDSPDRIKFLEKIKNKK